MQPVAKVFTRFCVTALVCSMAFAMLCTAQQALAQPTPTPEKSVLLYRWTDENGQYRYTDNYNAIPEQFRSTVVKGKFIAEQNGSSPDITPPPGAELTGRIDHFDNTYRTEGGYLHIQGKVRNGTNSTVASVKVRVTFFNQAGGVVRNESTLINPLELSPGAVGTYQLIVKLQPDIATFKTEINWKR